ncbi:cytochrome P450 monooxygenase 59 [Turnera subulata]|uniref:Peptidyl-prolyl cis-trans isomerase n=1 Tax=Turnera subulata TaxID=218843 RepID=A0A9Q0JBM4_9ROSI|nr:cytochrome P450 monooxygenase 59 [Turnera subulata]
MSVLIVTSLGEFTVDLYTDKCPLTCKNFLKLCKTKYYNGCLFHTVQKDFTAQTGDRTGTGTGGDSIYKSLYGDQARFFSDEIHLDLKHKKAGTVAMASAGENLNASQFYITLRDDLDYLDGKHTVFAEVAEGMDTLTRINEAVVDEKNRPLRNIRIKHTYILDDPFDDPPQLAELIPDASPEGKPKEEVVDDEVRLEDDWVPLDEQLAPEEIEEVLRAKDAHSSAVVLEAIGDIPDAEIKPPDNVLFVCKLNPVTEASLLPPFDDDLHTIFSRFGTVLSADVIRDYKTGDSLCYAFIEFETKEACEQAYYKMDNALIDDRRIHVDFSQSVAKQWAQFRRKDKMSKGTGCFKCGAPDHMAKDCTGDPSNKHIPAKYVLKDHDTQRGGYDNSRFDMVFDEDSPESPRGPRLEKRKRDYADGQIDGRKLPRRGSESQEHRDQEKKESHDRHRQSNRDRGHREDARHHESKASRYPEERVDRENYAADRRKERNDDRHPEERVDREKYADRRKERNDGRREDRDHRNRSSDVEGRGDGRDSGGYQKRGSGDDGKRHSDGDYRRRDADDYSPRRDRDYKTRNVDDDKRLRDESSHRKYDGHKGRREEREQQRHRGTESDDTRDRRHKYDRR